MAKRAQPGGLRELSELERGDPDMFGNQRAVVRHRFACGSHRRPRLDVCTIAADSSHPLLLAMASVFNHTVQFVSYWLIINDCQCNSLTTQRIQRKSTTCI
jgi:hypothetical protein